MGELLPFTVLSFSVFNILSINVVNNAFRADKQIEKSAQAATTYVHVSHVD